MSAATTRPLRYVACVSYPRSGHHLIVRILSEYFGPSFRYCQYYLDSHGDCCHQFPCTHAAVCLTKNHDMDVQDDPASGIPQVAGVPYLVLVRNFLEAAVSDYNLFLRRQADSPTAWREFARRKLDYYRRFVRKWALSDCQFERLLVRYEDLTAAPLAELTRIIAFFRPIADLDQARLQAVISRTALEDVGPRDTRLIEGHGVKSRRNVEQFTHYDPLFFRELESSLLSELTGLGYRRRYAA